jgi:hypothetical protein
MKTKLIPRGRAGRQSIKLIWACAWCGPDTYSPLKKGEEYTHGICMLHKVKLFTEIGKMGIRA